MVDNLAIGVMTSPNLKDRYTACKNTWVKDFKNVFLFGGESANQIDSSLISIKGAGEDYKSSFLKQQLGLKYMYDTNPNLDWYGIFGCDNVIFKEKTLEEMSKFNPEEDLFISQPCGLWTDQPYVREIQSDSESNGLVWRSVSGGAGFFLSRSLMKKCYSIIDEFNEHWLNISGSFWHGDIGISCMLKKYFDISCTHLIYLLSQTPSHYEDPVNHHWYKNYEIPITEVAKTPMVFHYIKPNEMADIYDRYSVEIKNPI